MARLTAEQIENIRSFINEFGLIPTCLITPSLARAYQSELDYRRYSGMADRVLSSIERDIVNEAYEYMMKRNNNRLHIWHKPDTFFEQLTLDFESY